MLQATLAAILTLALSAMAPGVLADHVATELQGRGGERAQVEVQLEADPLLDLPRGHVPAMTVRLRQAAWSGLPLPEMTLQLTDLRLTSQALMGLQPPALLAPAPISLQVAASEETLTAWLRQAVAIAIPDGFAVPLPLKKKLGERARLQALKVQLSDGRLQLQAEVVAARGAPLPIVVTAVPESPDGHRIRLAGAEATWAGRRIPGVVLKAMLRTLEARLDLATLPLPGDGWRFQGLEVISPLLKVELVGTLPADPAPWLRPAGFPAAPEQPASTGLQQTPDPRE